MSTTEVLSVYEIFEMFPDQETARRYIESRLWPEGPRCPECKGSDLLSLKNSLQGWYRCRKCLVAFNVRLGTVFEGSHIPLHKWLYAMYLLMTSRKGISSLQLSKEIGISQTGAWFLLHRLREACGNNLSALSGTVEVDETFIGGKEKNKHVSKRRYLGTGGAGKMAVLGMREKGVGGKSRAVVIRNLESHTLHSRIKDVVAAGSLIHTDEYVGYQGLEKLLGEGYTHQTVRHAAHQFSYNGISTNGIESVWALLKRGIHGTFHHVSPKYLQNYLNEFNFRLDEGNVSKPTMERLEGILAAVGGCRIKLKELRTVPGKFDDSLIASVKAYMRKPRAKRISRGCKSVEWHVTKVVKSFLEVKQWP